jgi:hypothetical protein
MPGRVRLLGLGVGAALAVALPAALIAQVADALDDGDGTPGVAYPLVGLVFAGMAVGGWVVGRRSAQGRLPLAALTGLVAISVVQAIGIGRRAVAGEDIAWRTVPAVVVLAVVLATATAALAGRPPGRTRP